MTEGGNASFLIVKGHYSQAEKNIHITLGCFILFCFLKENQKTKQIEKKKKRWWDKIIFLLQETLVKLLFLSFSIEKASVG